MELVYFDVAVLVVINLIEAVLQSEPSLHQDLDEVVKDFILGVLHLALLFNPS